MTGAASGMGRLYAQKLARMGYSLILVDIAADRLEQTAGVFAVMKPFLDFVNATIDDF